MHISSPLFTAAALLAPLTAAAGLYPKSSSVLNVDGKTFDKLIKQSNKASIVEFYAPWCGHCKNLKPAYEKAAKNLEGLANVAAVNCDDDDNKPFCGQMGIQGFPTLKTVKIGKKGKPIISDYQGPRTASGIVEAVSQLIPNTVKKVTDDKIESFLEEGNSTAKVLVFSNKGTTSTLVKVLSNEYGENMIFAQVRDKETTTNEMFGITEYPSIVVLPGGDRQPVKYEGKVERQALNMFFSSYASTWSYPDQAESKRSKKDKKAASSDSSTFAEASASHASSEAEEAAPSLHIEFVDEDDPDFPHESPRPIVDEDVATPIIVPDAIPTIEALDTYEQLQTNCLGPKTQTCVLALLPGTTDAETELSASSIDALASLGKISKKHKDRGDHLFPFYSIPEGNPGFLALKTSLGFSGESVELVAVNGKRSWYKHHDAEKGFGIESVEGWIDGIRFGEGKKEKLPEGLVVEIPPTEEPVAGEPIVEEEPIVVEVPEPGDTPEPEDIIDDIDEVETDEEPPEPLPHDEL